MIAHFLSTLDPRYAQQGKRSLAIRLNAVRAFLLSVESGCEPFCLHTTTSCDPQYVPSGLGETLTIGRISSFLLSKASIPYFSGPRYLYSAWAKQVVQSFPAMPMAALAPLLPRQRAKL